MVAGSTASGKSKARLFQKFIAASICKEFGLSEFDAVSRPMGSQGSDIIMSERARLVFPFSVECKRQEKLSIGKWMDQTCANAAKDQLAPLLVVRQNRDDAIAVILMKHLMTMVEGVGYPENCTAKIAMSSRSPMYKKSIAKCQAASQPGRWILKTVSPDRSYAAMPYMLFIEMVKNYQHEHDNTRISLSELFSSYSGEKN